MSATHFWSRYRQLQFTNEESKFLEKLWCCVGVGDSFFKQISSIKIYIQSEYVSKETGAASVSATHFWSRYRQLQFTNEESKFLEKLWCCVGVGDSFFKQISSIKIYIQSEYVSGETVVLRRCRRLVFEADIVNWGLYIKWVSFYRNRGATSLESITR